MPSLRVAMAGVLLPCALLVGALLTGAFVAGPAGAQPVPEICSKQKSCFITFDGSDRSFCQAYVEGKSCFMAFSDRTDTGWCQYLIEGKSCFMALDGAARTDCEAGRIPREHRRWMNLCSKGR